MYGIHHHGPMHGPVCCGPSLMGPRHMGPMHGPSIFGPRPMPHHHHGPHGFHRAHSDSHAAKTVVGGGTGALIGGALGALSCTPFGVAAGAAIGGLLGGALGNASCRWC